MWNWFDFYFIFRSKFESAKKKKSASQLKMNSCAILCEDRTNFKPSRTQGRRTVVKRVLRGGHIEASSTTRIQTTNRRSAQSTITSKQSVSVNRPPPCPYFQPTLLFDSSTPRPWPLQWTVISNTSILLQNLNELVAGPDRQSKQKQTNTSWSTDRWRCPNTFNFRLQLTNNARTSHIDHSDMEISSFSEYGELQAALQRVQAALVNSGSSGAAALGARTAAAARLLLTPPLAAALALHSALVRPPHRTRKLPAPHTRRAHHLAKDVSIVCMLYNGG